ncbi:Putative RNA polymerase II subunit B1 CTD phosphatase RPAP2, partial [Myotis davidii]
ILGTKQKSTLKQEDASKRKAELEETVRKKIEFERKALHIVEQLLEENITEEFLMECGKCITPAHYSDVVDERSIIKLCGYPLCHKKLGIVPKQKYKISTKTNKVYDITERKHDPTFPLIDSSSQNQIRKRIVLEKLSKVLPGLLGPLQITLGDIYTQLKNLVRTFRLTPILGIQKHSQENMVFTQFLATLLEELHLKNEDLENLTIIFRTGC